MELLIIMLITIISTVIVIAADATVTDTDDVAAFMNVIADKKISFWQLLKVNIKYSHHNKSSYLEAILKSFKKYIYINRLFKGLKIAVENKSYTTAKVLFSAIGNIISEYNNTVTSSNTSNAVISTINTISNITISVDAFTNNIANAITNIVTIATTIVNVSSKNIIEAANLIVSEAIAKNTENIVNIIASNINNALNIFAINATAIMVDTSIGIIDVLDSASNTLVSFTYIKELKKRNNINLSQLLKANIKFAYNSKSSYLEAILKSFKKYIYINRLFKGLKIAVENNKYCTAKVLFSAIEILKITNA